MNPARLKRPLRIAGIALATLAVVAGLAFVERSVDNVPVAELRVQVNGPGGTHFIDPDEVRRQVLEVAEGLIGTPVGRVDATAIEGALRELPCVRSAEVYGTLDGVVHVRVGQRRPIIRILNADGSGFYIDDTGWTMPLSSNFTARVLVATGELHEPYANSVIRVDASDSLAAVTWSDDLYRLALHVTADPLWDALFDQVLVSAADGLSLVPRVGMQRILIGEADQLEERFGKLQHYYAKGLPQAGWRRHATVDLRFAGQVVCSRRTTP